MYYLQLCLNSILYDLWIGFGQTYFKITNVKYTSPQLPGLNSRAEEESHTLGRRSMTAHLNASKQNTFILHPTDLNGFIHFWLYILIETLFIIYIYIVTAKSNTIIQKRVITKNHISIVFDC